MSDPAPASVTPPRALRSPWVVVIAGLVALALALAADPWAYAHIVKPNVYEVDWGRMLRVAGFFPTWALVALALALHDRGTGRIALRGGLLAITTVLAGLTGEVVKILVRRQRPGPVNAAYTFRAWSDRPFHSGGFGFPSSHAIVAFSAAAILARMFPRARVVFYAIAVGCAITRIMARAHYLSDTVAAALLGWLVAAAVWRWSARWRAPSAIVSR